MGERAVQEVVPIRIGGLYFEASIPPELGGVVDGVNLELRVRTEEELRLVVELVGGIGEFRNAATADRLLAIYSRNDIEDASVKADLNVWLEGGVGSLPTPRVPEAITRLLDEARAARALEERERIDVS